MNGGDDANEEVEPHFVACLHAGIDRLAAGSSANV
jgi:hypothetical protein